MKWANWRLYGGFDGYDGVVAMGELKDMAIALGCDLNAPCKLTAAERFAYREMMDQKPRYRWNSARLRWEGRKSKSEGYLE